MANLIVLRPIGVVRSPVTDEGDDGWGRVRSRIELDATRFGADCLTGLGEFSHVEVVFVFDRVREEDVCCGARHPRGRTDWPRVGIFAQRNRNRPNRIGVTVCRLVAVEGIGLEVEGLDAIDGTPVVDIKPYISVFAARGEVREAAWAGELMASYWDGPRRENSPNSRDRG